MSATLWFAGKSKIEVVMILQQLGLTVNPNQKSYNKVSLLCPYHADSTFGNAFMYVPSGVFVCKSCNTTRPVPNLVMDLKSCNRDEAFQALNIDQATMSLMEDTLPSLKAVEKKVKRRQAYFNPALSDLQLQNFSPEEYAYTRERGYTEEFISHFNIKLCDRGYLKSYMIIPLPDVSTEDYEARKIAERETIERITGRNTEGMTTKQVRNMITTFPAEYEGTWEERYYFQPRVKYRNDSRINHFLFQDNRLSRKDPVYVSEGTGGLSRIWLEVSRNVTCIFGAAISPEQIQKLLQFKEVYFLPDGDLASDKMLSLLIGISSVFRVVLLPPGVDDTSPAYAQEILRSPHISIGEYFHERQKKTPPLF